MNEPTQDPHQIGTSASSAAADRLCPGRWLAQRNLPDDRSEAAERGTRIHAALAQIDRQGVNQGARQALTDEERESFDACREIERKIITEIWGGEPDPSNRVFKEQRYWCKVPESDNQVLATFLHSGQADFVMFRKNTALVLDYKTGRSETVESPRNEQLRDLAVMVWRNLQSESVVVAIVQPPFESELCKYTAEDLTKAEQEMWERVRKSHDPASPRVAGDVQCKFCKAAAAGTCKEYVEWAASLLPEKESPFKLFCQDWTLEQKSLVAENIPRLRKLLDDSEDFLKACLKIDPNSVPGFYLKEGVTRESINDPQELFNRFAIEGGTLEQFMACISITKAKLEAQVREVSKLKGKGLKSKLDAMLEGITSSKQNSPSLAKIKKEIEE